LSIRVPGKSNVIAVHYASAMPLNEARMSPSGAQSSAPHFVLIEFAPPECEMPASLVHPAVIRLAPLLLIGRRNYFEPVLKAKPNTKEL
jgi:hypothetical protein